MNRISFQWRITLMTAVLIAGACICLNLLLYRSGATGMDNLNGYVLQYQQNDDENLMIEIPDDQMSDFLIQFSQEVYDAKAVFGRKGWCITAAVTLLSAAIAYFVSGKALEPLKKLAQQAERIDQDSLVEVRLEENTIPEFRNLSQSVNRMLDRLAQSFDLQRQFAGNAAHELKTPLMSISGYAEIIENNMVKPEDIPKFAGRIHSEASRLSSLVEDIIKLSRLDENDQSIPMEEVDLMQICRDVEGHLSIRAKEQQVKMTLRGESCRIKGARQVLYEMIYNLCDNAIKYNRRDGEVEVTVSRGRNGRAVVSVADTGIGIAKEDQERIFERFYRVDKSHSRETGGTGLGLSIVKHGAILHDAKIKIESTLGTGTKIILEF